MPQNYVPIFIFIAIVGSLLPITLLLAKLVRPSNPSKTKLMPYECGIDPIDSARGRYTVRYYIIAILFVVFDVETIFLFPWAVRFKAFGLVRIAGDADLPGDPDRRLHLGLEKRRAGVGVERPCAGETPLATAAGTAALPNAMTAATDNPMDSSPAETFHRQPLDAGQLLLPYPARHQPAAGRPRQVAAVRQQRREHFHVEDRVGAHFYRRVLVGDRD